MDIKSLRRTNLERLIDEQFNGNKALFGRAIGREPTQVYQWRMGIRGLGEDVARDIENKLSLSSGWLDQPAAEPFPMEELPPLLRIPLATCAAIVSELAGGGTQSRISRQGEPWGIYVTAKETEWLIRIVSQRAFEYPSGVKQFERWLGEAPNRAVAMWYELDDPTTAIFSSIYGDRGLDRLRQKPTNERGNIATPPRRVIAFDDTDTVGEDEVVVPRLTLKLSAGDGRLQWEIDEAGTPNRFRRSWCERKGVKPEHLVTVTVEGDSMSPTIPERASLTINTGDRSVRNGKVHAIDYLGDFYVKRLFKQPDGSVLVRSDNSDKTRYPDWMITPDHGDSVRILGAPISMSTDLD